MLKIIEMLGQEKWLYSHEGVSWIGICLTVILNALLFFLAGNSHWLGHSEIKNAKLIDFMFIDEIKIYAQAGHGGKGCVAFPV